MPVLAERYCTIENHLKCSDINHPFYLREVKKFYTNWKRYPNYYLYELIKCDFCKCYFSAEMYQYHYIYEDYEKTRLNKNKCKYCNTDEYFTGIAKSYLSGIGIKSKDQTPELIELQSFIAKTRYILQGKHKNDLFKFKTQTNDYKSNEQQ